MRKWRPLAANGTPGIWADVQNMLPSRSGSYYTPNVVVALVGAGPATPGTTLRAWCALLPDDTSICYVGTTTKLYTQANAGSGFTDRSRAGAYTNTATDWSFGQFGKISIACNRVDATQFRDATTATAFADLAGAPKAAIAVTQQSQVLLFDLNDGAEKPDYFIACAPGDYTTWTGASATGPNPIWNRPGRITAAVAYRDYVLVFKRSSVYRLTYTGTSLKWKVELIAAGRGAFSKHDAAVCGDVVVFRGPGGAWSYDGSTFREIAEFGPTWAAGDSGAASVASFYSPYTANIFFCNFAGGSNIIYVYNIASDRWGMFNANGSLGTTYRMLTGEPAALRVFDSRAGTTFPEVNYFYDLALNPAAVASTAQWGNVGNAGVGAFLTGGTEGIGAVGLGGRQQTVFKGVNVDYTTSAPMQTHIATTDTALSLLVYTGDTPDASGIIANGGGTIVQNVTSSTPQRRFDFLQSAVYARFRINVPDTAGVGGTLEIADYEPVMDASSL